MAHITVLGAGGFIGSHLARQLVDLGHKVEIPGRGEDLTGRDLGRVAFCIGLTGDFRQRPLDTVEAHVCKLLAVLRECQFESLLYLSSTRVYGDGPALEDASISVRPSDPSDLYNLSKLAGESLCLHSGRSVRIARLSNVFGADFTSRNFLSELIRAAVDTGEVALRTTLASAKDYISVGEATNVLTWMLTGPCAHAVYNVASGYNTANSEIAEVLAKATGCSLRVEDNARESFFPAIDVARLRAERPCEGQPVTKAIAQLVALYRQIRSQKA